MKPPINKKVLVVEDDADLLYILQSTLAGEGFKVIAAGNGEDGAKQAMAQRPDLIILDIIMPKMDGIQVAQKIKDAGIKSPIIFLTNVKDFDSMSKALEVAAADYIVKSDMSIDNVVLRVKAKLGIK